MNIQFFSRAKEVQYCQETSYVLMLYNFLSDRTNIRLIELLCSSNSVLTRYITILSDRTKSNGFDILQIPPVSRIRKQNPKSNKHSLSIYVIIQPMCVLSQDNAAEGIKFILCQQVAPRTECLLRQSVYNLHNRSIYRSPEYSETHTSNLSQYCQTGQFNRMDTIYIVAGLPAYRKSRETIYIQYK